MGMLAVGAYTREMRRLDLQLGCFDGNIYYTSRADVLRTVACCTVRGRVVVIIGFGRGQGQARMNPFPTDVSNEMDNVFHDREGVCPMDAMRKLAEV